MNALNFVDKTDTEYLTEQKDWGNLDRPGMVVPGLSVISSSLLRTGSVSLHGVRLAAFSWCSVMMLLNRTLICEGSVAVTSPRWA